MTKLTRIFRQHATALFLTCQRGMSAAALLAFTPTLAPESGNRKRVAGI